MSGSKAGDEVQYTITYLEMTERPTFPRPHLFGKEPSALIHAEAPPNWYFLNLYDAVGAAYEWRDLHEWDEEKLTAYVSSPDMHIYTFLRNGWPHGFFSLDCREKGVCDLAYFGLVPEALGKGIGTWMLQTAILMGWDMPGCERMTVQTCTLDHPRALALYQKHGFIPTRRETHSRVLTRDREHP